MASSCQEYLCRIVLIYVCGAHPACFTMGIEYLFSGKRGGSVALTTHFHLAPRLKKQ